MSNNNTDWAINHSSSNAGWLAGNTTDGKKAEAASQRRKKSLTLRDVGAKLISEGRTQADLTLDDLKLLDPMSLPPKLRVKVQDQHPLYVRESEKYGKKQPNEDCEGSRSTDSDSGGGCGNGCGAGGRDGNTDYGSTEPVVKEQPYDDGGGSASTDSDSDTGNGSSSLVYRGRFV